MSLAENIMSGILHPITWFANRKVTELATTMTVRKAIFREIIRLHFDWYTHTSAADKLDSDRARGLAAKVAEQLEPQFDWSTVNPEGQDVREEVAKAVTMAVVPTDTWVTIRELSDRDSFNPSHFVVLSFRDGTGTTHYSTVRVAAIQDHFLFIKPFVFLGPETREGPSAIVARVSPRVSAMAKARLGPEQVELLKFQLSATSPDPRSAFNDARPE